MTMKFYQHRFQAMGTPCDLQLYAQSPSQAQQVIQLVVNDILRLEARYSRYRQDSLLSEINRVAAQGGSLTVDAETASLLNYAHTCYLQSEGLFDITSGILRQAWRFEQASLPSQAHLEDLLTKVGWDKVFWQEPRLEFTLPGIELDFGGIVKEYAADRAVSLCWAEDIRHGFVNLGGDIKVIGPRPEQQPWCIGIRDPQKPTATLRNVFLRSGAIASSGDYERCIRIDNKRYAHVLNPYTGWPVQYLSAVSVVAEFCVLAGSVATIAMLKADAGPQWLAELGLAHLWVNELGECGGDLSRAER